MHDDQSLARRVDAAQSILATPAALEARRLEDALAASNAALAATMARLDPGSGAASLQNPAGTAIFAGAGSPATQGLAMGLAGAVAAADLDAIERHLRPGGGGALQVELCPFADPSLPALLAARGYRVHEWQLTWTQQVQRGPLAPPPPELTVRLVRPGEEDEYLRAVLAGFLESEDVPREAMDMIRPTAHTAGYELFVALLGDEVIGGASLAWEGGVAFVNGSGVRPAFRRRGAQGALIRARLERAGALGCELACSTTLPGTASRRNMERHGFSVAYPKLVLVKDG